MWRFFSSAIFDSPCLGINPKGLIDLYQIFNLGNSATVSLNEFIDIVEQVSGHKLQIEQLPPQPGDVDLTNADISRARQILGYNPRTPFAEGMENFHRWYLSHRHDS
jgi:UDP-glucuronate 4-epimerase